MYNCLMQVLSVESIDPKVRYVNYYQVPPHTSWMNRKIPDFELIYIVQGTYLFSTNDESEEIIEGEVLLIFPYETHSFYPKDPEKESLISCIHGEFTTQGCYANMDYRLEPKPERITRFETAEMKAHMHDLFYYCQIAFSSQCRNELLYTSYVKTILLHLCERWKNPEEIQVHKTISHIITYIKANIDKNLTRSDIARYCNLSESYVSSFFSKHAAITLSQCIHRVKMEEAYTLLYDKGLSVKETAYALGFQDPAHFSRLFKKIMNICPKETKKQHYS